MNSITKKWLRGSLLTTLLVLLLAEGLFLFQSYNLYYGGVRQAVNSRFASISGQLKMYTGDEKATQSQRRSQALRRMVEQFDEKDKFEFTLLDAGGQVLASSTGRAGELSSLEDFQQAMASPEGRGEAIYRSAAGERVLAITILTPYQAEDIAALRLVTSLTLVDEQVIRLIWISLGVAAAVLGFSLWSGLFFIRSIVTPLHQVERVAHEIAQGSLDARLPDQGRDDEIGRLCGAINRMAQDLSKTEQMKNEFLSSVSHELRTPLTSIRGWVETIAAIRDPADENYQKGLTIIGRETDRLYDMVEELLDFSRLQSGMKMNCQTLDLVAELTDAALFVEARMNQAGLRLVYEEPELPLPVWADAGRLRQVFINLLDNAIKYSNPGGAITLELLQDGENVYVLIQDEGRGISPEDLVNVKQKFFKGKNSVRGSGIGLAVAEEIITALDGTLDLESTLGKGTKVKIRLPLCRPGPQAQPAP